MNKTDTRRDSQETNMRALHWGGGDCFVCRDSRFNEVPRAPPNQSFIKRRCWIKSDPGEPERIDPDHLLEVDRIWGI